MAMTEQDRITEIGCDRTAISEQARAIARKLTEAQRRALLAFPEPYFTETVMQGRVKSQPSATAREMGVSGATLMSLNGLGGVDPETLECGPILVSYEWGEPGKRYWHPTPLGLQVRSYLESHQP